MRKITGTHVHVHPINDIRAHVFDDEGTCWCAPEYYPDACLYVHNAADQREDFETGKRKPS